MVFGKKKPAPAPKKTSSEPKNDLASKLKEQKAQKEAQQKSTAQNEEQSSTSTDNVPTKVETADSGKTVKPAGQSAKLDDEWEAKLKEIMRETGQEDSAPRPKGRVVTKPDGTKVYVYDNAYGAAVTDGQTRGQRSGQPSDQLSGQPNDQPSKGQEVDSPTSQGLRNAKNKQPPAPQEDFDEMKGFDDFYSWVKNGRMADIDTCEDVMFGKK